VDSKGANKNAEECREDVKDHLILYEILGALMWSIEWNKGA
jgi:hypothetical protein